MATINLEESQNLSFSCLPCLYFLLSAIVALHLSRTLYKFAPFYAKQSQFPKSQVNVSIFSKMVYENKSDWTLGENKPKTKPKQSQSKPIKPNLPDAQMSVNSILTKDYERNDIFAVPENKANSNPIQSQFFSEGSIWI
ncbi:MAG: hypothetical protein ACYTBX_03160 [Planctomycetota bacterium]|jgi:hypothetical protein